MYKRKAFLHWYRDEGVDYSEFEEAKNIMNNLIFDYLQWQDTITSEDYYESEDDS